MSETRKLLDEDDEHKNLIRVMVYGDPLDSSLPHMAVPKMLLPPECTHSRLLQHVKNKLKIEQSDFLYLWCDGPPDPTACYNKNVGDLHKSYAKSDGFLHFYYSKKPPEPSERNSCCCCCC